MHRLALLLPALALAGCADKTYLLPNYCGNSDGDAYCAREAPDRPYCVLGLDECFDAANLGEFSNGCVADTPPPECYTPCGVDNGDACLDPTNPTGSSGSGSTTDEPSSTTEGETGTETDGPSTTSGPECMDNAECMDAALPFCVDEVCSPCSASVDVTPDEACAGLDEATPLCIGDACVQCSASNASACEGTTPLCDDASNTCIACSFHEECQDNLDLPACNIATGACFSNDAVTPVNLSGANALQNAVNAVADGAEHAIVITGGSGLHTVTVDGGKTIAIVSDSDAVRTINGSTSAVLTVTGNGTTVFLHRVRLEDSDDAGVSVESSATLYADSTQVIGNDGGGIELAAGTSGFLRNCMVGRNGDEFASTTGIDSAGDLNVLYSSIIANDGDGADSLLCGGGAAVVRNSIFIGSDASSIDCGTLDASNSAFDEAVPGDENENVGALDPGWFQSLASADFRLTTAGQSEFADVATWELGDPPFDFDGTDRPNTDGAADYAGADVP